MVEIPRRTMLKTIGTGALLSVGGVGVAAARKGKRQGASAGLNLLDTALSLNSSGPFAGEFDELVAAVTANPGVAALLSDPDVQVTVFAPVDAGFDNIGVAGGDVSADILEYHVTRGRRYAKSVVRAPRLRMLNGVVAVDGTVLNDGQAEIVVTNVEASNGVIHAIGPVDGGSEGGVLLQD